jgi:predicted site-specific integrase-resolvase
MGSITMSEQTQRRYISLEEASEQLDVSRTTLYYYMKQFSIKAEKFPLDRRAYILHSDFEKIREAKQRASEGSH